MTIALLATGNELIIGDTLNTNGNRIAHALHSEGLDLGLHLACGDEEKEIIDCLKFLSLNHSVIIVIGGLGPTSDDRTRFALSRFLNTPLIDFPKAQEHIQQRLLNSPLAASKGNQQQAKFPQGASLLPNPNGTAMGCSIVHGKQRFFLLPGPPRECLPMFNDYVLTQLHQNQPSNKQLLKWRVFGVAESDIAERLDNALKHLDCQTGYRLESPYIECKVICSPPLSNTIKAIVEPLLAPYIIASIDKTASEKLRDDIIYWQKPITLLDDVTGGILQSLIQRPENYSLIKFHEEKPAATIFHLQGLTEYWTSQPSHGETRVTIRYQHELSSGEESHNLPYRSAMAPLIAAEWLCFRLSHLINQLHQCVA